MHKKLADALRAFRATEAFHGSHMAGMYRPLVRGFMAVVASYYLIYGVLLQPFLESFHTSLIMVPLRLSLAVVAGLGYWLTRATTSMPRLELAALCVGLHMVGNFLINQTTGFKSETLFIFELILLLMAAVSPTLRVYLVLTIATVSAWLWIVYSHDRAAMKAIISVMVPSVIGSGIIWGLINSALVSARRALTLAEAHGEELERFAYVCSHDMQEPVRMMNTYAGLLVEETQGNLSGDAQRYVGYIRDNAVRMQRMIRDILNFSRVGREAIILETVDCQAVAQEVITEFDAYVVRTQAKVLCADLPTIQASQTLVRLVLQNLIGNALKFQDGTRPPEVVVAAEKIKGAWRFEISDNGIGIDPAFRDKVFTLFQRLNRKEDYPGTGIGLSTCRKFLRLCGGDIDFEARPGGGTSFFFTLPDVASATRA